MARSQAIEERVKELVEALLAEEAAEEEGDRHVTIDDIEEGMVRIGDLVACEFGVRKLARHMSPPPEHPPCPGCGHAGDRVGEQTRELITRRGDVPVTEAKYRCPKCRRHFFPSDGRARA